MITLQIDNSEVENIFTQGFSGDKESFLAFIKSSYNKRESLRAFDEDQERFMQTYKQMKNGSMEMLSEEEAEQDMDKFLTSL